MKVIFKMIDDWPEYLAGSDGNIYSLHTRGRGTAMRTVPHIRQPRIDHKGRPALDLCGRGLRKPYMVCRLVAKAFHGPCPEGLQVSHRNGNPADNRPDNLLYETAAENNKRRIEHGTANFMYSLSSLQVQALREVVQYGVPEALLGRLLGISQTQVNRIITRKSRKGT